jgi:hypothetical protein
MVRRARASFVIGLCLLTLGLPSDAGAQPAGTVSLAGGVAVARIDELDGTDVGATGRLAWQPASILGVEAEVALYPSEFPDRPAISRRRAEVLVGATVGPVLGRARPFARLRVGAVSYGEAPRPIACIAIFPPPLNCQLASGQTLAALDLGAGFDLAIVGRVFARVDVGDRLVRYPGPSLSRGQLRDDRFWAHELRAAVSAGFRF